MHHCDYVRKHNGKEKRESADTVFDRVLYASVMAC